MEKEEIYFYVCDRKACVPCNNEECRHTTDINHAKYNEHTEFEKYKVQTDNKKIDGYFEVEKCEISN